MPKPIRVELDATSKILRVGKKTYRLAQEVVVKGETQKVIFEPMSQKQWDARISRIADYLVGKSKITARAILKNALNEMEIAKIEQIERKIQKPHRPKVRVQEGCMAVVVGGIDVPII